jgi:cytoskeletal protein RodZ
MAWFNRNKKSTIVLPELEKYYEAERRERTGLAWILAFVSVAGVALVLIGVFFGGRWTYRHFKNDKPSTVAVIETENTTTTDQAESSKTPDTSKPVTTPAPVTTTTPTPSATTPAPTKTTDTSTPKASSSTTQLTNTGPEDVAPAFMTATATGILLYRRKLAKTARKI